MNLKVRENDRRTELAQDRVQSRVLALEVFDLPVLLAVCYFG
jgi:hypothetical protein